MILVVILNNIEKIIEELVGLVVSLSLMIGELERGEFISNLEILLENVVEIFVNLWDIFIDLNSLINIIML